MKTSYVAKVYEMILRSMTEMEPCVSIYREFLYDRVLSLFNRLILAQTTFIEYRVSHLSRLRHAYKRIHSAIPDEWWQGNRRVAAFCNLSATASIEVGR